MGAGEFANLLQPLDIGPFTLKNRMVVAPHGPMYAQGGLLTQRYVDYEVEKARGGAGLVVMSFGHADPGPPESLLVSTWRRENMAPWREVVAGVHAHGARVFFQFGESPWRTGMGASAWPYTGMNNASTREMTRADIRRAMDAFARCAQVIAEAGLDGIEMHGHGDYFSDFLSPTMNRRTDEYGGSFDNRMRFIEEAIDVFRAVIGRGMVLGARLSVDDQLPGSVPLESGVAIARRLAAGGKLDYLSIDTVIEPQLLPRMIAPMYAEPGHQLYACAAVKQAVTNIPIFGVGRIVDPATAERAIAEGKCDAVAMARALIADPEFPNKVAQGRAADIRPCLGDNQECIAPVVRYMPMGCTVNAAAGHEGQWGIGRIAAAPVRRRILVVGAGPGGMEAARVAALRGHEVLLWEQSDALGGSVRLAERLPGRADIGRIVPWLRRQLEQLGVRVTLGVQATAERILAQRPDAVVLATGARWLKNGYNALDFRVVPGWEQPHVLAVDAAVQRADAGANVVIFDAKGFVEAPGIAELFADRGSRVEIVTPFPHLGTDALQATHQWSWIMPRLLARGVRITPDSRLSAIEDHAVAVENLHTGAVVARDDIDTVVMISARECNDALFHALEGSGLELHRVGDCASPLNIGGAIGTGFRVGVAL
ncbi:MAG: FAD-dependent oxidoreductase [Gammaproteobacteria bacterium]